MSGTSQPLERVVILGAGGHGLVVADILLRAHDAVIIAIGNNRARARLFQQMQRRGARLAIARHPSAVIAPDVRIGPWTMICAGAIANPGSVIGASVLLNTGSTIDHHNEIGDAVHIAPGVHLGGRVVVGEGALVGIGATVMPGRTIGPWATVGAGACVTRDVPPGITVVGVPARQGVS
jgi:sugar O-acyltransferase (sialic acid O-acetyltransferase NeuD family)